MRVGNQTPYIFYSCMCTPLLLPWYTHAYGRCMSSCSRSICGCVSALLCRSLCSACAVALLHSCMYVCRDVWLVACLCCVSLRCCVYVCVSVWCERVGGCLVEGHAAQPALELQHWHPVHSRCVDTYILNVHAGGIYSEFETFGGYNSVVANGKGIFALADVRTPPVRMWQK